MKKLYSAAVLSVLCTVLCAQQEYTISGYVKDASNGENLIGVNIFARLLNTGSVSNTYGYYALTLPSGKREIEFQFIGYEPKVVRLNLSKDTIIDIGLKPQNTQLQEVEVTSERLDQNVSSVEMSVAVMDVKEIKKLPALLGEVDLMRSLTLLPGVSSLGEGSSGINVRGGASDQNLILLDEAPVYNSSHLFGLFSIFNPDAVKDVKLYKGGIPAQYGGRLSSVIDVRQIEGNSKKFEARGGIGLLSSRGLIEGPIVKDKVSFMLAGRRSYADVFLGLSNDPDLNQNILYFYDLNAKINWKIDPKNKVFLSGYFGRDVFGIRSFFDFDWGNTTLSSRWNHIFSPKVFSNFTFIFSDYTYSLGTPSEEEFVFRLNSTIQDYHLKAQFNYYPNDKNDIDFGLEGIYYRFQPGVINGDVFVELQQEFAVEPSAYISHEVRFSPLFKLQYGLRYSSFYNVGARTVLQYENPDLPFESKIEDSLKFARGAIIKGYDGLQGLEPRLSAVYQLDDERSFKASYNRTRQYIHLISNTTSPTPVDIYRPAGKYIKPATVNQVATGYFQNFEQNTYEASLEAYFKSFNNIVDYRNGADLIFNEGIETELLRGVARSYGLEFFLRKNKGKFTGWISYTLSKTENRVAETRENLAINSGEWYPANYDKRHDLSVTLNYQITDKWSVGTNFLYQTGRPVTPPEGRFEYDGISVPIYRSRNSYRIPDYHRLDLSANYTPKADTSKWVNSSWSFGFYNVYARRNAYSIFFEQEPATPQNTNTFNTRAIRLSLFGTIVPFVTWNFQF